MNRSSRSRSVTLMAVLSLLGFVGCGDDSSLISADGTSNALTITDGGGVASSGSTGASAPSGGQQPPCRR